MSNVIIQTDALTRRFGTRVAVDALTLEVHRGEVFGLLGPNGAGKSTTVRLLNGVLASHGGSARVFGQDVAAQAAQIRRRVGVLTETPTVYDGLTARQNLELVGEVYGLEPAQLPARIAEVLAEFELQTRADDKVATYSKGMRQRLAIARTFIHGPELVYLDEPTSGLDPEAARMVVELVQQQAHREGRTIFICTHNLDEAERLCDRVGVIDQGRMLAIGSPAELAHQLWQGYRVVIKLAEPLSDQQLQSLGEVTSRGDANNPPTLLEFSLPGLQAVPDLVSALCGVGARIVRVDPQHHSLRDIYFAVRQRHQRSGEGQ